MSTHTEDLSKLLSSAALVFVGSVIASTSTLLERVVVGRLLPPTLYGEYSIALAIFTLSATFGAAGLTQGVPRFMARFDTPEDKRGAWLTGLGISLGVSSLITVSLLVGSPFLIPRLFETDAAAPMYYVFVVSIPVYVAFKIGIGGIRGEENTRYKLLTQNLFYPLVRLTLIAALLLLGVGLVGTGVGYLVALVGVTILTYKLLSRLFTLRGEYRLHGRQMTAFSAPLVVSTVINVLLTRTDTLMLGYLRSSELVGIYNAAYPLAGVMLVVLSAFGYMYLPMASRLDGDEDESVGRIYEVTTKWVYLSVFPMFVTVLVFPSDIVSVAFGAGYAGAGAALSILIVGSFTSAAFGRNRETLSALGATKFIMVSNAVAFVVNVVLNLVLIPRYGVVGAAVASTGSYVSLNLVVYGFLRRRFGISPFTRSSMKTYAALPLVLIPLGFALKRVFPAAVHVGALPGSVPVIAAFAAVLVVATVTVVVIVGGLEPEDAILLDFVEDTVGVRVPFVRRFIPED
ncbi:flippase [Haloarculaceae archaeon H-GB1-1]|nr:flippase [Haloarculaceae archaeon H-GB1-1]